MGAVHRRWFGLLVILLCVMGLVLSIAALAQTSAADDSANATGFAGYSLVYAVAALGALVTAWLTEPWRGGTAARHLTALIIAAAWWACAATAETAATTVQGKLLWSQIAYPGTTSMPLFYLLFAAAYTGREWVFRRWRVALLAVSPLITCLVAFTNAAHGWLWSSVRIVPATGLAVYEHGPYFFFSATQAYLYLAWGALLLIRSNRQAQRVNRRQVQAILWAMALPVACNLVYLSPLNPLPGLDWTVPGFAASAAIMGWALARLRLLDVAPLARAVLVDTMNAAVLVIDQQGHVCDLNPAMQRLLGVPTLQAMGRSASEVLAPASNLVATLQGGTPGRMSITWPLADAPRRFDVEIERIPGQREDSRARLLVLHDVTEREQLVADLRRAEDHLRRREAILSAVGQATTQLLAGTSTAAIAQALRLLGEATQSATVSLYRLDADGTSVVLHSDWNRSTALADQAARQRTAAEAMDASRIERLARGEAVEITTDDVDPEQEAPMHTAGVVSTVLVPVQVEGTWWGVLSVTSERERDWPAAELEALGIAGRALGAAQARQAHLDALRKSESRLSDILSSVHDAVWSLSWPKLETLYVSPAIERIYGRAADEFVSNSQLWSSAVHPDDRHIAASTIADLRTTGSSLKEFRIVRPDGSIVWVQDSGHLVRDDLGNLSQVNGITSDISHRIRSERTTAARLELIEYAARHTVDELLAKTVKEVCALVDSPVGFFQLLDPDESALPLPRSSMSGPGRLSQVASQGYWMPAAAAPEGSTQPELVRELVVPVVREGKTVAILGVGNKPMDYTSDDFDFVDFLADVTWEIIARKRSDAALHESMAYARSLIDSVPDMLFVLSAQGRFLDFKADRRDLFARPEQFIGKHYRAVLPPSLVEQIDAALAHALKRTDMLALNYTLPGEGGPRHFAARLVSFGEDKLIASVRDVTAERRAEQELAKQSRMRQQLMELSSVFIYLPLDAVDQAIYHALGDLGASVGADRAYVFRYDFRAQVTTNTHEWCAEGISSQINALQAIPLELVPDWVAAHQRGDAVYVPDVSALPPSGLRDTLEPQEIKSLLSLPLMDGSDCLGFVGFDSVREHRSYSESERDLLIFLGQMLVNVKKRQWAEEDLLRARAAAEEANHAKSEFLASMSHEIRTPLNGVMGMTELALGTELTGEQREYLNMAHDSAESLLDLINDILDFSKIESRHLELEHVDFGLEQLVASAIGPFSLRAADKGLELILDLAPETPELLRGDPVRLRQVLVNLLANAVKFTEAGEVELTVGLASADDKGLVLEFAVRDTGIGIPKEKQAAIFDAFVQVDRSTTRRYGGTGLGLAISKRLVEVMGGQLAVDSEPGQGSTFSFTCRLSRASGTVEDQAADLDAMGDALRDLTVLVVDDNTANCRIMARNLEFWGMRVTMADSGPAALQAIQQAEEASAPFGLLVVDASMPGMDGYVLAQSIRQHAAWRKVPLLMLSPEPDLRACRVAGVQACLRKPVARADLLDGILTALAAAEPLVGTAPAADTPGRAVRPLRVLLAEDNPVNQRVAATMLRRRGHQVEIAANGVQALERALLGHLDVILMDVEMPEMDGLEATRRIRQAEADAGRHVPILALTAHAVRGDRDKCLAAGMDGYVTKPVRQQSLIDTVEGIPVAPPGEESPGALHEFRLDTLWEAVAGDAALAREILTMFTDEARSHEQGMGSAHSAGDLAALAHVAHAFKGASATVGATGLAQAAARLEQAARAGDADAAGALLAALKADLQLVLPSIERALHNLQSHT